jgi:hypothetical protein
VILYERCLSAKTAKVTKVQEKPTKKWKPLPLTTVELQQMAKRFLRITGQQAMDVAEKLYQKGFISYPRTETDRFDKGINLRALVQKQTQDGESGQGKPDDASKDAQDKDAGKPDDKDGARKDAAADTGANAQDGKASDKPDAAQQQALKQDLDRALAGKKDNDKPDDRDGKPTAAQESEDDATREKRQALEHWLERVPDDPGGLLRRKFQLEYQRRQQRGGDGG